MNPRLAEKLSARAAEIACWREQGLTLQDIAGRLCVSLKVVREWTAANPIPLPEKEPGTLQTLRLKQAVGLLADGHNWEETAKAMGTTRAALESFRRRHRAAWQAEVDRLASNGVLLRRYRRVSITPRVETGIRRATALVAAGRAMGQIAAELQVHVDALEDWREEHRQLWDRELERAMQAAVILIRSQAGTDAVLADPAEYLRRAAVAERWTRQNGQDLFERNGAMTLCTFYRDYYKPTRLTAASPKTAESYEVSLRRWALITGDPPLSEITTPILSRFRDCLAKLRGRAAHLPMSPNRIRSILRHVQTVLDKAGPSGPRHRDAADILAKVPWVRPPKEELGEPRFVTDAELQAAYNASTAMDVPKIPGFKAPAWWRALIVTTYNLGLRHRTLFELRMEHIDWGRNRMAIPPGRLKSCRLLVLPMNETVREHLQAIRTDREMVFPWPMKDNRFYHYWHKLLDAAGIPSESRFGLHALRKTLATQLWALAPQAATLALGHAAASTTMKHYVNANGILADAMKKLPQPW